MINKNAVWFSLLLFAVACRGDSTKRRKSIPPVGMSAYLHEIMDIKDEMQGTKKTSGTPVAVYVARTTSEPGYANPVTFNEVLVNEGSAWDQSTNKLTLPSSGVYFFHLNAGAMNQSMVNMDLLIGETNYIDVLRKSKSHTGADTLGRSFIFSVTENDTVYVSNALEFPLYSDSGRQTSLTILSLEEYLDVDPVIFSASRVNPFYELGLLEFNVIEVNMGDRFIAADNYFIAPSEGIYFFALSSGLRPSSSLSISLLKNGDVVTELWRQSDIHDDVDTTGTSLLLELQQNDVVSVELRSGEMHSDFSRQIFFGGFLYNPAYVEAAAWSVARTAPSVGEDPLLFDVVEVNTGIFNRSDGTVYITKSGVYYVSFSICANALVPADVFLVRGRSRVEANIYRETPYNNGKDTFSQALLLRLEAGNTLRVVVRDGTMICSDGLRQTLFSGFLIAP